MRLLLSVDLYSAHYVAQRGPGGDGRAAAVAVVLGTGRYQPSPRSLAAEDWAGSGRRIMRNAIAIPTSAASSETSKATWRARFRASVLMLRISCWTASGWPA